MTFNFSDTTKTGNGFRGKLTWSKFLPTLYRNVCNVLPCFASVFSTSCVPTLTRYCSLDPYGVIVITK